MSGWLPQFLLALFPLLLLVGLLLHGRYPGEEAIQSFRQMLIRLLFGRRSGGEAPASPSAREFVSSGGALIAHSLAGRGPPLLN